MKNFHDKILLVQKKKERNFLVVYICMNPLFL